MTINKLTAMRPRRLRGKPRTMKFVLPLVLLTLWAGLGYAQVKETINGVVRDAGNQPLNGVSVEIKGFDGGTMTDANGYFELEAVLPVTLVFSHFGYETSELLAKEKGAVAVTLREGAASVLDQVVVVGYGTQKKADVISAIDVVNVEQIESRGNANVVQSLQGLSPNLNISMNSTTSNEPGGDMAINIRGVGSLSGSYAPYILVDGVPMDLTLVNPNDIESINVLKDAAAAAIYGARGAFGVILITTKNGGASDKVKVTYSNNFSFSNPIGRPHMENSLKYMTAFDQANVNARLGTNFTEENYDRVRKYMAGEITEETWLLPDSSDWHGNGIWDIAGNANNDWMYIYFRDLTMRQQHNVSLSGGGKRTSYYASASLWDQPDELAFGDQYYKRYNITANISSRATDWLTFNINNKYIAEETQYFNTKDGYNRNTFYHDFYRTGPFRPMVLPNGEYSDISNLPSLVDGGKINVYSSNYVLSVGATIEPIRDWQTTVSYNYSTNDGRYHDNQKTIYGTNPRGEPYIHAYNVSKYVTNFNKNETQLFNITSAYQKTFRKHLFYLMGGAESQQYLGNTMNGQKSNILAPSIPSISTATGTFLLSDAKSHWATESYFGRFRYSFGKKYMLEVNARYDGSSRFAPGKRWGLFPGVAVGYNISEESFWTSLRPYVNHFKLRGTWGELGNQQVANYLYLPSMGMGTNLNWVMGTARPEYVTAQGLVSADLTWETITTKNIGFDAEFLRSRLSASFDLYTRITSNMFGPAEALPSTLGTGVPQTNNATIKTNGFDLDIIWRDRIGKEASYSVRATLSDNVTTVTDYNNPTRTRSTWYVGQTLGELWGLQTVGIYQSDEEAAKGPDQKIFFPTWGAGDIQYRDLDGDGKITRGKQTADSSGDYSIIGNNSPRYSVGLQGQLKWKGFDFSMFWQGILKRDFSFQNIDMAFYGFRANQWWDMNTFYKGNNTTLDYWRPADETNILGPNTDAYYPKPYMSTEDNKNKEVQSRYTQSAAYLRLKNLTIGYTLPASISSKAFIESARVYVSGENLLTITSLTKLMDPEALYRQSYGVTKGHFLRRVYSVGIDISFK